MSECRFSLYRLCECPTCEGKGKTFDYAGPWSSDPDSGEDWKEIKCPECRGEGRIRQEIASCATPEAVGVAIVTLGREREWEGCAFGLLDRYPECALCGGTGERYEGGLTNIICPECKGSGVKPTGTWLVLPWGPSPRQVRDAAKMLRAQREDVKAANLAK